MRKIILIGGSEDRKDKKETLKKIVEISNSGRIGICTSALYDNPMDLFYTYKESFESIGAKDVLSFDIRNTKEADCSDNLKKLDIVDAVFFTGGDQVRLSEIFIGTMFLKKLKSKVCEGEIVYCGSSAGSMIAPKKIIYDGDYKGLIKGTVNSGIGFGIVEDMLIDTHFFKRMRLERMSQSLLKGLENKGIGLTENSGVLILDDICEVIGRGTVAFIDVFKAKTSLYEKVKIGENLTVADLNVNLLSCGDKFCLKKWKIN